MRLVSGMWSLPPAHPVFPEGYALISLFPNRSLNLHQLRLVLLSTDWQFFPLPWDFLQPSKFPGHVTCKNGAHVESEWILC